MNKVLCRIVLAILVFTSCSHSDRMEKTDTEYALISKDSLFNAKEYTSLKEALAHHNLVYKLNLSRQHLKTLPPEFTNLRHLQYLDISDNDFTELPDCIFSCTNIQELIFYGNKITSIPSRISTLVHLTSLNGRHNQIKTLPAEIGTLKELKDITLMYNELYSIPKEMGNLKNLNWFDISENHLSEIDFDLSGFAKGTYIDVYQNNFSESYIASLVKKYPNVEFQNDDCTFNSDFKTLSTEELDSMGFHHYIWNPNDSTATAKLDDGNKLSVKIGGCDYYQNSKELKIHHDSTSLNDSIYWKKKLIWLFEKSSSPKVEYRFEFVSINDNKLEYKIVYDGISKEEDNVPMDDFYVIRTGKTDCVVRYAWYMN